MRKQDGISGVITASTGTASTVGFKCLGLGSVGIDIRGTFSATLVVEGSINGGQNYFPLTIYPTAMTIGVTSITAPGSWFVNAATLTDVRIRASSYSSGTINAVLTGTAQSSAIIEKLGFSSTAYLSITNTATNLITNSAELIGFHLHNVNTANVYLQVFDSLASGVVLGTTLPKESFQIQPVGSRRLVQLDMPLFYSTAISYAVTSTVVGNGSPGTAITGWLFYISS